MSSVQTETTTRCQGTNRDAFVEIPHTMHPTHIPPFFPHFHMPKTKEESFRGKKKKKNHFIIPIPFIYRQLAHTLLPLSTITTQHNMATPIPSSTTTTTINSTTPLFFFFFFFFFFLLSCSSLTEAQQEYVNNKQLDCDNIYNSTLGNICNSIPSCQSYLTFKSSTPKYTTPSSISYLLSSTPSLIASSNNITDADVIPSDTLITVPVTCSCFTNKNGSYYQHNASYTLKEASETYFTVANNTYQALTTCQALVAQNPNYPVRDLKVGETLHVPLRCACPTKKQSDAGFKYLLTYLVSEGESVSSIAEIFGVDENSILEANELSASSIIFFFTPISVPLKTEPPKRLQSVAAPPPL